MSLAYELKAGTIQFTTTGDVEHSGALETLKAGLAAAAVNPIPNGWHLLFDIRNSTENRDPNELRNTATAIALHRAALSGRCAVVAADPLHYGLARMFGVFMDGIGFEAHVCKDLENATHWLNTPQPT